MDEGLRAEAIFHYLRALRKYCKSFPDYNIAVNLNGMNGCVDVKVFKDNVCIECFLDPEDSLVEMLTRALRFMTDNCGPIPLVPEEQKPPVLQHEAADWREYASCPTCFAVMNEACKNLVSGGERVTPHMGRVRFRVMS